MHGLGAEAGVSHGTVGRWVTSGSCTGWEEDAASRQLGMEAVIIELDHAVVRMQVTAQMVNGHGICHGGYVFALADSTFALVCNSPGLLTVAAGCDITFVAPVREDGVVVAEMRGRSRRIAR